MCCILFGLKKIISKADKREIKQNKQNNKNSLKYGSTKNEDNSRNNSDGDIRVSELPDNASKHAE